MAPIANSSNGISQSARALSSAIAGSDAMSSAWITIHAVSAASTHTEAASQVNRCRSVDSACKVARQCHAKPTKPISNNKLRSANGMWDRVNRHKQKQPNWPYLRPRVQAAGIHKLALILN
jgi:hypothetical protein